MATVTPNIGLTLPAGNEKVSRQVINDNMTIIDTAFGNAHDSSVDSMQAGLSNVVDGDTTDEAIPAGAYAYLKNNTHGLAEGYYQNISGSAFPTSGGTANITTFAPVSTAGILNSLNNKINPYSTSEVVCGTWIDGSTIYRRVYEFGSLPNASIKYLASGLSGVATKIISLTGVAYDRSQTYNIRPLPLADATTANNIRLDMIADGRFSITTGANWSSYDAIIYVEYIK